MPEVMKEYGEYILEAFIVICLAFVLVSASSDDAGNRGIFFVIGSKMPVKSEDYHAYTDFRETYQGECNKLEPKIWCLGNYLKAGMQKMSDYFWAIDYSGRELPVKIESIKGPDGAELIDTYNPDTTEIDLAEPGVYVFVVSALDDINRSARRSIQIPVNK